MELAERKKNILRAIVEGYIATGEAVGSKTLLQETGINVSPATIRNDMADLTQNGYLYQPHTSAGRIPTQKACRYYIDNLMPLKAPSARACDYIDNKLSLSADTPENLLRTAAELLSDYTGFAAVTTTPPVTEARVHRLHFLATGRHTAMVVLVTTTGMVRNRLFRCNFVITNEVTEVLQKILNKALSGTPLSELTKPFMQTVASAFPDLLMLTPQALVAVMEIAAQAQETEICTSGQSRLLFMPDVDIPTARGIMSFLQSKEKVSRLLFEGKSGMRFFLGTECGAPELQGCTVISARYEIAGKTAGSVALFGPARMDYAAAAGAVAYIAKATGNLLDEMIDI
ncbi:MAG: heat-inducible transcription repressor HrcA [Ruminococcaceae bacterium]|nr:heat-inducible transcription repressor HrcA [Oscillospiraceae bacterium]